MTEKIHCAQCGNECIPTGCTTGYGTDNSGRKICFACCGKNDLRTLQKTGDSKGLPLYLAKSQQGYLKVTNWPGTLTFPVTFSRLSKTNMDLKRTDVWFVVADHELWHGVHIGHNTDIVHCKRTKKRWEKP